MENLVCIYTCESHAEQLNLLKNSPLYDDLTNSNHRIIEVRSGGTHTEFLGGNLICKGTESYDALSIKTYEMIDYCFKNFEYDHLIKIDCTLAFDEENEPEKWKRQFTTTEVSNFVNKSSYLDYDGIQSQCATMLSFRRWAIRKNIKTESVANLIGNNTANRFYTGKCYSISRNFSKFVSINCKNVAYSFAKRYGGIEDLFIGKSYYNFRVLDEVR